MPTTKERHTCIRCGAKLIESKMVRVINGWNRYTNHWRCADYRNCVRPTAVTLTPAGVQNPGKYTSELNPDAQEQLFFNGNEFPDLDTDLASLLPDYVKKRQKYGF